LIAAIAAMDSFHCGNARRRIRYTLAETAEDIDGHCYAETAFACETCVSSAGERRYWCHFYKVQDAVGAH